MKKYLFALIVMMLSGCESPPERPKISRVGDYTPAGMTYNEFSSRELTRGSDGTDVQKRFISLDRNGNGMLSRDEIGNYGD